MRLHSATSDSFGVLTTDSAPSVGFPLGFAGGLADSDTGLVHFGARDYDPALGRWTARDPIDYAGGDANLYGYCVGDPVGWVDPKGLWSIGVVQNYDQGFLTLQRATMGQGIHYVSSGDIVATSFVGCSPDDPERGTWQAEIPGQVSINPVGVQITNATCPSQLTGTVDTYGIDSFFLTLEGWKTEQGVWSLTASFGIGLNPLVNVHGGTQETWLR